MGRHKHTRSAINPIFDDDEVVVLGELMFVYAMQTPLLRGATEAVAVWDEAGIRLLAPFSLGCVDGVMILGNVQVQEMLIWKIPLAFRAPVQVGLAVVNVIVFKGGEIKGLMRRQRALHDGGLVRESRVGI